MGRARGEKQGENKMFRAECRGESSLVWHPGEAPVEKSNGIIF